MEWQTKLNWEFPAKREINYKSKVIFTGSCFADNLGQDFVDHKIPSILNPFGVIFNPISLSKTLTLNTANWSSSRVVQRDGGFVSLDAHSKIYSNSKEILLDNLMNQTELFRKDISEATDLFITLGTAWAFEKDGEIVANCHKLDSSMFKKRLLSVKEMTIHMKHALVELLKVNPLLKVYISVSPVRHIKNGLIENNRSKARLIETAHVLVDSIEGAIYLPAYEYLMDELRDYRFYKKDLIHPSEEAIEYVLEVFKKQLFSEKTFEIYNLHSKINKLLSHNPLLDVNGHQTKLLKLKEEIDVLMKA